MRQEKRNSQMELIEIDHIVSEPTLIREIFVIEEEHPAVIENKKYKCCILT